MTDSTLPAPKPRFSATASIVSVHKVAQVVGSLVTVVLVPRLLGAEVYGRFAFLLSLTYLGQILGDFGTLDVFGRFVPGQGTEENRKLYMATLAFKLPVGLASGLLTAGGAMMLGDWMRPEWALLSGLSVALRIVAWVPFQFSLGLNHIGAWMTEQAWRQWVLLLGLMVLFPVLGLGGALLALVAMEVIFCGMGLAWARDHWQATALRMDWAYYRPYLRAGVGFFLANLAAVALYRSGPVLVEALTGETAQTGYIDLAIGMFLLVYVTVSQYAQSLIPALSRFHQQGDGEAQQRWLASFLRLGLLITVLGTATVWLLADWAAPLVFGQGFGSVAPALRWISLGMPFAVLAWTGNVMATVLGRGRIKFGASLAALVVFGGTAALLIPVTAATGAAQALVLALVTHVAVLAAGLRSQFDFAGLLLAGKMAGGP